MGKHDNKPLKKFTPDDVNNRELVIQMLKYEEELTKSDEGQSLYKNKLNCPLRTLTVEKILNRMTLTKFDFSNEDDDVETYRTIFKTYYKSPDDYDNEVISSVHYMRENKCVYYKTPPLKLGEKIPDCKLFNLDGTTQTTLHDIINKRNAKYTVVAAFSLT